MTIRQPHRLRSMQRFKNILVLYDRKIGDEAALRRASALAERNQARLTVVEVVEKLPRDLLALLVQTAETERDLQERFIREREAHLERLIASIRKKGIDVGCAVLRGTPFLEVIRAVLHDKHDLVVAAADSWRGLRAITFGSTSMHLMRKCPCPVWVMKPRAGARFRRILAAVDPGLSPVAADATNLKIMQLASSLARTEQCDLDILSVWDFVGPDLDSIRSELSLEIREQLVDRTRSAREEALERLVKQVDLNGVRNQVLLVRGDPAQAIPQAVQEKNVDLIVMGTVSRTGIAGFFIGNTAEEVLRQVDCSVLTVKPDGFVTPVTVEG
ncbi:MAG: universal stress protein [Alphaproteobacteria bacterium]|nr:universal stress protein [Alphaproteobacteria bacterium]